MRMRAKITRNRIRAKKSETGPLKKPGPELIKKFRSFYLSAYLMIKNVKILDNIALS